MPEQKLSYIPLFTAFSDIISFFHTAPEPPHTISPRSSIYGRFLHLFFHFHRQLHVNIQNTLQYLFQSLTVYTNIYYRPMLCTQFLDTPITLLLVTFTFQHTLTSLCKLSSETATIPIAHTRWVCLPLLSIKLQTHHISHSSCIHLLSHPYTT